MYQLAKEKAKQSCQQAQTLLNSINDYLLKHRFILEDCLGGLKELYGGSDEETNG